MDLSTAMNIADRLSNGNADQKQGREIIDEQFEEKLEDEGEEVGFEDYMTSENDDNSEEDVGNVGNYLQQSRRILIPMHNPRRGQGSDDEEGGMASGGGGGFRPIGLPRSEKARLQRLRTLRENITRQNRGNWMCKFCKIGDGKIDGKSSANLKMIYNMEEELRGMRQEQFIRIIVDKFNEFVVEQNNIRGSEVELEQLTYDEYELHLYDCYARRSVKETMWQRVESYINEIDYIREHGLKYITDNGRFALGHKDAQVVTHFETHCRQYLLAIDRLETRQKRDNEKARQRLNSAVSRQEKSFYDK